MSQKSIVSMLEPILGKLTDGTPAEKMVPHTGALVLASRSKKHFDRLHNALPADCRFTREDASILKEIVGQLVSKGSTSELAPSDDSILQLLSVIRGSANLQYYYREELHKGTFEKRWTNLQRVNFFWNNTPLSQKFLSADLVTLWREWKTRIVFSRYELDGKKYVLISFVWREFELNEPFVHAIRSHVAAKLMYATSSWNAGSPYLTCCYLLSDNGIMNLLEKTELEFPHDELGWEHRERTEGFLITDTFLAEVRKRLIADGIEIDELRPTSQQTKGITTHQLPVDVRLK